MLVYIWDFVFVHWWRVDEWHESVFTHASLAVTFEASKLHLVGRGLLTYQFNHDPIPFLVVNRLIDRFLGEIDYFTEAFRSLRYLKGLKGLKALIGQIRIYQAVVEVAIPRGFAIICPLCRPIFQIGVANSHVDFDIVWIANYFARCVRFRSRFSHQ